MSSGDREGASEPVKPKFRPKAQARKKPAPPPPPGEYDHKAAAANYRARGAEDVGDDGGGYGRGDGRGRGGRGYGGRGHRERDRRSTGRGGRDGRGAHGRDGRGGGGRGRGGFIPVGQDFFVGGGGSGPAAYMPAGNVSTGQAWGSSGGGHGGRPRGGGDTSESEAEEEERKRLRKSGKKKSSSESGGKGKLKSEREEGEDKRKDDGDEDDDMFGVGDGLVADGSEKEGGQGEGAEGADEFFGSLGKTRVKGSRVPGMKITGNVMSEEDVMRPVALPVTATAQDPTAKLFASADNQAELEEEEDSSLFFVQLPTKVPRPLPAYRRSLSAPKGKAKAKAHGVKEEVGDPEGGGSSSAGGSGKGKAPAAATTATTTESAKALPQDDVAFDQGLRRMTPGKIGKLYVHKSGHARLVIGGVSLSMQSGLAVSFVEEGVSINATAQKSFCSFGQVTKRAICTPDFEQLYRRAQGGPAERGEGGRDGLSEGGPVAMELD